MNTYGATFQESLDGERVRTQMQVIRDFMLSHDFVTLSEIEHCLKYPSASISAQLRHLKKDKFGGYELEKKRLSINNAGTWLYKLTSREPNKQETLF